ncbi:MAG: 2OG-Fe(II) oxygenase [Cyclobacteriaceae bacterium]|nr:2OG-Fe(II) oxygenase [Cyclobacteriaceae bacterium]
MTQNIFGDWSSSNNLKIQQNPFPHVVIDDFLDVEIVNKINNFFPSVDNKWISYIHYNEKKFGLSDPQFIPENILELINELSSKEFCNKLSDIIGIKGLVADPLLEGGGLHQTFRGGFLNIHSDFSVHPRNHNLKRQINLLLYFNKDWLPEYYGELELWDESLEKCHVKIAPQFNRCVIFKTDEKSFHGSPIPLNCPENVSRKSIALYYYTNELKNPVSGYTNYRTRKGDGKNGILIFLDNKLLHVYSFLRNKMDLKDSLVSRFLRIFK